MAQQVERIPWMGRVCNTLERVTLRVAGALLAVMLVVAWLHVYRRYVLNNALPWSEEFLRYALVWFAMLSASIIFKQRGHLGLVFVVQALPEGARGRLDRTARWLLLILSVAVSLQGYLLLWRVHGQLTPALRIPMWLPYASIPVSFTLMGIYAAWHLLSAGPYTEGNADENTAGEQSK